MKPFTAIVPVGVRRERLADGQAAVNQGAPADRSWLVTTIRLVIRREVRWVVASHNGVDAVWLTLGARAGHERFVLGRIVVDGKLLVISGVPTCREQHGYCH